ncbi:protein f09f7.1 [Plakobranchus ocellatus]|uniref:Protein f09f7.1 n=1 Tax=Plakobranchus ocellatus TaxID=259542 RepID=A0AAV3ZXL0_9GAST|nr:protein f09f7.1 [Plakobranchus ocellatus]
MATFIPILLVTVCPYLVVGQSSKLQWFPEEMFNPLTQPRKCGLNTDEPSFVCDPNRILGDQLDSFNWILRDAAYNGTKCPCSNYYCENNRGAIGYRIGLALVRQMKLQKGADGRRNKPEDQAQLFAMRLENDLWDMGNCEEDIIIFYSQNDQMLAMYGGSTALAKLTPYYRNLLAYRVGSRFEDGQIVEALNNLIYDLKLVLNCDTRDPKIDCGLHELRASAAATTVSMAITMSALLVAALFSNVL